MAFDANAMMLELFRSEVESHSESLTSSLLQLEREQPGKGFFDSMMRAAHSIKGAARIVGVSQVVDISHVMEDCFVAAQRGELSLGPDHVDVMLRGVDLMVKISEGTKDTAPETLALTPQVEAVVEQLKCVRSGQPVLAAQQPAAHTVEPIPVDAKPTAPAPASPISPTPLATSSATTAAISSSQPVAQSSHQPPARPDQLRLVGPATLDETQAKNLRRQLLDHWQAGGTRIVIDLSKTTEIDAVGLAFLASAKKLVATQPGASITLQPLSTEMQMVLRVAGVDP